jgi:predicted adenine nucleotide alpha hydrolase (AANH) superfamily ATPase
LTGKRCSKCQTLRAPSSGSKASLRSPFSRAAEVLSISERLRRMADEANVERQAGYPEEAEGLKRLTGKRCSKCQTLRAPSSGSKASLRSPFSRASP